MGTSRTALILSLLAGLCLPILPTWAGHTDASPNAPPAAQPPPVCTLHTGASCPPSVSGRLRWLRTLASTGRLSGPLAAAVPLTVRFAQAPIAADLDALRQLGELSPFTVQGLCLAQRPNAPAGSCAAATTFIVPLSVRWDNFDRLLTLPGIVQIDADAAADLIPPLDISTPEMHTAAAPFFPVLPADLTGAGVTIANIDTGVDVFHPLLFRADGGEFAWLDRNSNGVFEPGLDMVDLNGNGEPDAGEWLAVVDATSVQFDGYPRPYDVPGANDGLFVSDTDWLFNDANTNGQRDYGAGFDDSTPSLGERVFLVKDTNGNRQLDSGENLISLGTNKVARVLDVGGVTRQRGVDLSQTAPDVYTHGTSVLGILAGGWPHISRYTGIAPDAELLLADPYLSGNTLSTAMFWAISNGADIVIHEYTHISQEFFDGSSNHELLIAEAQRQGVVQVLPAGNINRGHKHTFVTVSAGAGAVLPLFHPTGNGATASDMTLVWPGDPAALQATLTTPAGETFTLLGDANSLLTADGHFIAGARLRSSRGTGRLDFHVTRTPIASGAFTLTITNTNTAAIGISAFVQDNRTAWLGGMEWTTPRNPAFSVIWPATADAGVVVGSYSTRGFDGGLDAVAAGDLSHFSGQGPRIDGQPVLDVTAPSNYDIATALDRTQTGQWGQYRWFSGTSGAAPHVGGALALLRQARPDLTATQIEEALRAGARRDGFTGTSATEAFGAGKVDVAGALRHLLPFAPLRAARLAGQIPAIDGVMLPGEWDAAAHVQIPLAYLTQTPQQGVMDLWLMASPGAGERLLVAAQISSVELTADDALWLWFGGGDVRSLGADGWQDWHWLDGRLLLDQTQHGRGAVSQVSGMRIFELALPLAASDAADVQLTPRHDNPFAVAFSQPFSDTLGVGRVAAAAWPPDFHLAQWDKLGRLALTPAIDGDLTGDGVADVVDLQSVAAHWNLTSSDPGYDAIFDLNADGRIDLLDVQAIEEMWD